MLFFQTDDQVTQHLLVDLQKALDFLGNFGFSAEIHQHIVTLSLVVDGVSKAALAPFIDLFHHTAVGGDLRGHLFDQLLAGSVFEGGVDDVHHFVFVQTLSPPYGLWPRAFRTEQGGSPHLQALHAKYRL